MIRGAACIDVVGVELQAGAMVQQAVQNVGGLVGRRRDDPDMVRTVLVRDVGVEAETGAAAIPGVHLAGDVAALAGTEELAVR